MHSTVPLSAEPLSAEPLSAEPLSAEPLSAEGRWDYPAEPVERPWKKFGV